MPITHAHIGIRGKVGRIELPMGADRETKRIGRLLEDDEERIALGLDLRAVIGRDMCAHCGVVARQDLRVLGAERGE